MIASISLGLCNLILAAIVHSADEAREADTEFIAHTKRVYEEHQRSRLIKLCEKIDADGGGSLSYQEIRGAYDDVPEVKAVFDAMSLNKEDVNSLLQIADGDGSG